MLQFNETFNKGHEITKSDAPLIMKCTNINFEHTKWKPVKNDYTYFYEDHDLIKHIIDHVVDINKHDNDDYKRSTLMEKIVQLNDLKLFEYVLNNGYININSLNIHKYKIYGRYYRMINQTIYNMKNKCFDDLKKFVLFLDKVSFGQFKGYYNLLEHNYIMFIMLLVIKVIKKSNTNMYCLPLPIIKHKIIPFIYQ